MKLRQAGVKWVLGWKKGALDSGAVKKHAEGKGGRK